jgi:hypothetical protein
MAIYKFRGIGAIVRVSDLWQSLKSIFSKPRKYLLSMWHNRSSHKPHTSSRFLLRTLTNIFFLELDAIKDGRSQIIVDLWSFVEGFMVVKI